VRPETDTLPSCAEQPHSRQLQQVAEKRQFAMPTTANPQIAQITQIFFPTALRMNLGEDQTISTAGKFTPSGSRGGSGWNEHRSVYFHTNRDQSTAILTGRPTVPFLLICVICEICGCAVFPQPAREKWVAAGLLARPRSSARARRPAPTRRVDGFLRMRSPHRPVRRFATSGGIPYFCRPSFRPLLSMTPVDDPGRSRRSISPRSGSDVSWQSTTSR
jgi:hypothetical protein